MTESILETEGPPADQAVVADAIPPDAPLTVIQPRPGWQALDLRDIWQYRELLFFLTWRDVLIRYKQTVFGVAWAVLQPVMTMVVFTLIFGKAVGLENRTGGIPYALYVFAGLLPWEFFSKAMTASGQSVVSSANVITKVYFPRLIVPIAATGANLVDLAISFVVFAVMMACYVAFTGYELAIGPAILLLPVLLLLTVMASLSVGVWLSAMMVAYRDFRYVVPFATRILIYLSPVIYPVTIIPEKLRWLIALNPMTGIINGYRYCLLGQRLEWYTLLIAVGVTLACFLFSLFYFRRVESTFADTI